MFNNDCVVVVVFHLVPEKGAGWITVYWQYTYMDVFLSLGHFSDTM